MIRILLFIGFLIRFIFSRHLHPIENFVFSDMETYQVIAGRLVNGEVTIANIFYPLGYPLFLAVFRNPIIVSFIHSLSSVIAVYFLFDLSKKNLSRKWSLLFLLILTFYYPWIDYTGYYLSETLATLAISLILWLSYRHQSKNFVWLFLLPYAIGFAIVIRSNLLLPGILCLLWSIAQVKKNKTKAVKVALVSSLIIFTFITLLNKHFSGRGNLLSLNGGFVFMEGQCRYRGATDVNGWTFGPPVYTQRDFTDEYTFSEAFTNSNYFYHEGLKCLVAKPLTIFKKPWEIYYLFFGNVAWPSSDQYGFKTPMAVSHNLFAVLVIPGLILAFCKKNRPIPLSLIVASLIATSVVYHADIRYRIPFDGIILLLAFWGYSKPVRE